MHQQRIHRIAPERAPVALVLPPASPEQIIEALSKRLDLAHESGGAAAGSLITLTPDGRAEIIAKAKGNIGHALCLLFHALPSDIEFVDHVLENMAAPTSCPFRIGAQRVSDFGEPIESIEQFKDWHQHGKHWTMLNLRVREVAEKRWALLDDATQQLLPRLQEATARILSSFRTVLSYEDVN